MRSCTAAAGNTPRTWAVATAVATTWPESSSSSPARNATSRPRRTIRPRPVSRPGRAGRRNCTCKSVVGAKRPGPSVATSAGPRVSSSIAARNPPWITPTGFRNCSLALNATSIVPPSGSTAISSQPSRTAAGGGAARPSITSQNGPSRVTRPFLSDPLVDHEARRGAGRHGTGLSPRRNALQPGFHGVPAQPEGGFSSRGAGRIRRGRLRCRDGPSPGHGCGRRSPGGKVPRLRRDGPGARPAGPARRGR